MKRFSRFDSSYQAARFLSISLCSMMRKCGPSYISTELNHTLSTSLTVTTTKAATTTTTTATTTTTTRPCFPVLYNSSRNSPHGTLLSIVQYQNISFTLEILLWQKHGNAQCFQNTSKIQQQLLQVTNLTADNLAFTTALQQLHEIYDSGQRHMCHIWLSFY